MKTIHLFLAVDVLLTFVLQPLLGISPIGGNQFTQFSILLGTALFIVAVIEFFKK